MKHSFLLLAFIASAMIGHSQTVIVNPLVEGGFTLGPSFAANGWTEVNGAVPNKWFVGTVPAAFPSNSAFISADNGVTQGYNNGSISVVHFYRDVTFPAGETAINLSFDWQALGEAGFWDAVIVSLAPTTYTPTASTTSLGTSNLGAPTVELGRFWNSSTVQSVNIPIPGSVAGNCSGSSTMRLIFTWKNDGGGGSNPSAAIDNIALLSSGSPLTTAGGTFTIDNTLPLSGTNFPSFTAAITALNAAAGCGAFTGPVVFNVTAGQTFNELPPVITATGTAVNTITFQRSGAGVNPVISSTGTAGTNDASITISGGDYFTFDGIDINNSVGTTMEYGYLLRNASATNGATNNILRNMSVQMNRNVTTSSAAAILVSTTTTGGGVAATSAAGANSNNIIRDFTINGAINGVSLLGTSGFPDIANVVNTSSVAIRNSITNVGPTTSTSVSAKGIQLSNQSGATVGNNSISAVTSNQASAHGIFVTGNVGNSFITGNFITGISNQGSTSTTSVAYGIQVQNNTTGTHNVRVSNNMISNIFTSFTGAATASRYAVGIFAGVASAGSTQSYDIYNNSVSIGSGLTPTYSNTCFEIQNVAAVYRLQNNIFANFTNAQAGAARHYTYVTTSATNLGASGSISNRNDLFVANDAGVTGFVGRANATEQATLANWTAAITAIPGTDANSASINPTFVDNTTNLHLNFGVTPTPLESGGASVGVTTDYDGDARPGPAGSVNGGATAPDMGADEFDGVPTLPIVTLNSVTPAATTQCATTARLVSVNVTTPSGTITGVNLVYAFNGTPQAPVAMTNTAGTTWEASIPVATPANATVTWSVVATNSLGYNGNVVGTTYTDEPLFGTTGSVSASSTTVCSGSPTTLTAAVSRPAALNSGPGGNTSSASPDSPFHHFYGGVKSQYIFRASELTAMGLTPGAISAFSINVTSLGTPGLNNFTIDMGHTAQNAAVTNTAIVSGLTQVYSTATRTLVAGANTFTFSTPFIWDGASNVVISICWTNNNTGGTSTTVTTDPAVAFTSSLSIRADNTSAACLYPAVSSGLGCMGTNTNNTGSIRPRFIFTGNTAPAISAISWSDGVGTVGTTNPLTVNPTATTTYTATITAAGCTVTPAPSATVTVNPLPTAPTATNSAQCGTQVPSASVASTSGLPTPTFIWYDAAVAGTALQTSTSTTYTSNVATTTTFYVSELNTVTGCESARVPVTVTVAAADGVSASASSATICIGNSVTLTAANTNPTPNQSYTYSWSGTANSGAATPVAGSPAVITPTQPGTYTYNLTAVDGGCNAVATVNVTVDPFAATLAPIDVTCNGYNNGSFSLSGSTCGTMPYTYSVDGGTFGAIPTNLAPGTYSVVVEDANGYQTPAQNVVITEPSTTIAAPTGTNATVCQGDLNAPVSATSNTNQPTTPAPLVLSFPLAAQPTETQAAPGITISSATVPALPAGAVVTSVTIGMNGLVPHGGEYQSDVRLGLSGIFTDAAAAGTGTIGFGTVAETPYNYTRTIPGAGFPITGGTINLVYWNNFNDVAGDDVTFPIGASAGTLTINYTVPTPASITWWDAASAGTQIGSGSPFETVGTSVLPNTNTPGVYTVYAQGEFGGCNGLTRTPVTITVNAPSASTTTITACGSYLWTNGTTYNTSGTYTQTLTNAAGCDSIATLNLTINQPTSSTVTEVACSSYTWAENSTTYTTSGSYSVVLAGANANGCDSTITLNLTINQPTTSSLTVAACSSYTWAENSTTYNTSGAYSVTLPGANANGCDSTITLNLTINQPTTSSLTVAACSSYTWAENSTTYNTSGAYSVTLPGANANGCDSTITLNLTINQPTSSTVTEVACGSYTWAENGTTYNTSGAYSVTLPGANANGCDSTITLNLTINQPSSSTVTEVACGSYTWAENNTTYTVSGSYSVVLAGANAVGCDSTVTLNLTINQPTSSTVTESACESYTWAENGTTYTTSGSYSVTIAGGAANGCDSTITLVLTITGNPTATATDNGDATITASTGTAYQWINCATNTAIAGATSQTYTATANGDYAVVVTVAGGCSDTSDCVTIDYIGLKEITDASIQVFPNPTNSDVTITMTATQATVEVTDAQGKLLQAVTVGNGEKVNLSTYETGIYFLRIRTVNGSTLERVVKQ
ncbi:MAG TPA: T9SS type A sorting domain-containing protein [Fluviicola sp.]|nr:T9SS type A sorting domain-containing protein [Fluviicola sp.]